MGFLVNGSNKCAFKRSRRVEREPLALARAVIFVGIVFGVTPFEQNQHALCGKAHGRPVVIESAHIAGGHCHAI